MKSKKHYLVYKITNAANRKTYIGCHKTDNPDDHYMGSGKVLKRSMLKYGIENFKKEILFDFSNSEEMFAKEKELIAELKPVYNLHEGGNGGFDYINNLPRNPEWMKKRADTASKTFKLRFENDEAFSQKIKLMASTRMKERHLRGEIKYDTFTGRKHSDETKKKMSFAARGRVPWNKGKHHSEETKRKISETLKNK